MPRVTDLSFPIEEHFRWGQTLEQVQSFGQGDVFQTSRVTMSCHAFTHADAVAHVVPGGPTLGQMDVHRWVGEAAVIDLTWCESGHGITGEELESAGDHVREDDIALLKTCWDSRQSVRSPRYWSSAPYVTRSAAEWLLDRQVRSVGFDFPQDYAIRRMIQGEQPEPHEFTTHHLLLRRGVGLVEYLCNLEQVAARRVFLVAAPINVAAADGAPVRALAVEFD